MGVVNVTPDSFSDGGNYFSDRAAVDQALSLEASGADVLDVGGESTRPGSEPVSADEQCRRILPVIEGIRAHSDVLISVDTTSAYVARRALASGADIVNDISAFRFDSEMLDVLADAGCGAIAMHTLGRPKVMQDNISYHDVVHEVREHLEARVAAAMTAGVLKSRLVIDPGIGFGKRLSDNLALLHHLDTFQALGCPVLVGTSRKSFLGQVTGRPVEDRDQATAASCACAILKGAQIVRVHNVEAVLDAVKVADAIVHAAAPLAD